jgi:chorismate mutase / prephenate dehydratase
MRELDAGALAGRRAAERYGLRVLVPDIEDRSDNQTRFLIVRPAMEPDTSPPPAGGPLGKSLLLARVPNRSGGLLHLLQPFADAGLNLSKLETHPDSEPWTSLFFLEVEAPASDPAMAGAIAAARSVALELRLLGSYPRWPVAERA